LELILIRRIAMSTRDYAKGVLIIPLLLSCALLRPASVTVQSNPDGTETRQVRRGRSEQDADVQKRLLSSIECPRYDIVGGGWGADQLHQPSDLYWIRYRCKEKE
jgi:hypothetical protein